MLNQLESDTVRKLWNEHGARGLFLASAALQIILLVLGNLRKCNPRALIRISLWIVYYLAYIVVPTALAATAQSTSDAPTRELLCFWASFLLLHLGGPDTFTAYSLEDNELWLRHSLFMLFQSLLALYILLSTLPGCSHLPMLSIPVFVAAFIKCFGRVQALRLGSTEHLRRSMLGPPVPGPDYVKLTEEFQLKTSQGFMVKADEIAQPPLPVINADAASPNKEILEAHRLFKIFNPLFLDLILTYEDKDISTSYFRNLDSSSAFRAVELELGLAYDMHFTMANVNCTTKGLILRAACAFLILVVLVGFHFLIDIGHYPFVDVVITYLVMSADTLKEIFYLINMVCSDWAELWLNQQNYMRNSCIFPFRLKTPSQRRWSNSISQLDLLSVALKEKPARVLRLQKLFGVDEFLEKQRYEARTEVSANLKDMIYTQFREYINNSDNKPLSVHRGSYSLQKNKCIKLLWSINDVAFDQSILVWHIATSLCYYSQDDDQFGINRTESNHISKYMLNLLVSNPEMLPKGIGMIRYRDTCADAKRFFEKKGPCNSIAEACRNLLKVKCDKVLPSVAIGDRSKTVLFDGCRLAQALMEEINDPERMWKVISQVWIEILGYAAANCGGFHHSQQLGRGGQLLTHVWLLMAHLGLTDHFQVTKGHARAKLIVS